MKAYHQITPESLGTLLEHGLARSSRGSKGDDPLIAQTDRVLDRNLPDHIKNQEISREDNLYAYVYSSGEVIDITLGTRLPIEQFIADSKEPILELAIDHSRCFVSDLDAYDEVKSAVEAGKDASHLDRLAAGYWQAVRSMKEFNPPDIRRPEIMITYDVPPECVKVLKG